MPIVDLLNGDPLAPFSDFEVANDSTETGTIPCGNDQLARGMAYLSRAMVRHAGQSVTYRRGSTAVALCATLGQSVVYRRQDEDGGFYYERSDLDFLIPADALVSDGTPIVPRRGDTIAYDGRTYQVLSQGGQPPWRWTDAYQVMRRIHTKLVDE